VQVSRGLVIQSTEERQRRTYTVRNEDDAARVVVIEHPARAGWTLSGSLTPAESTAAWHRLRVPVGPKTTVTFTVEEVRPVQTQFAVNAITDQQVALLVQDQAISAPIEAALRQVITRKAEVARLTAEAAAREAQIAQISQDQERVRENMKSLQGTREERQLLQRYVKQLNEQENRLDELRGELKSLTTQRQAAEAELGRFIEAMST
jgi:DNA repair exonuclease SbcCD ATPase subunit